MFPSLLVDGRREEREEKRRDEGTARGGSRRPNKGFKERRKGKNTGIAVESI